MVPEIDVIVLQYGQPEMTARLFKSMKRANAPIRVIFIDNGSTDEEYQKARAALEKTDLPVLHVRVSPNVGFTRGANIGLALATAPYVVIQGNDTLVFPEGYERMRKALDAEKIPSIVGPLTSSCGSPQRLRGMGHQWPKYFEQLQKVGILNEPDERRAHLIRTILNGRVGVLPEFLPFFCVMMKRTTLEKVGLLDAAFSPGFGEDNDYCIRVRRAGGKLLVALDVYVTHEHRATFSKTMGKENVAALQKRNLGILKRKWE